MEKLAWRRWIHRTVGRMASVHGVSEDRAANRRHMNPYLVGASGEDVALDSGYLCARLAASFLKRFGKRRHRAVERDGILSVLLDNRHFLAVPGGSPNQIFDASFSRDGDAMDHGKVSFPDVGVGGERLGQRIHRVLRLCDDHDAGSVLIESMHDSRSGNAAYSL